MSKMTRMSEATAVRRLLPCWTVIKNDCADRVHRLAIQLNGGDWRMLFAKTMRSSKCMLNDLFAGSIHNLWTHSSSLCFTFHLRLHVSNNANLVDFPCYNMVY